MRINRRDLLQGKLWKLLGPAKHQPLVMRYPKPEPKFDPKLLRPDSTDDGRGQQPRSQPKSIAGISIEPVPTTSFANQPPPTTIPVFRPPGAIEERQFMRDCTRCGDCITACPYQAIVLAPARLGPVAGTPVIDADTSACLMCEDFPCIAACEPGVLTRAIAPIMGTAQVTAHLCLAHHGTTCTVCSERCPVAGAIVVEDGKPTVEEDVCTGCGVCRFVCPAPENAILLMPALIRPSLVDQKPA